ncbi:plexin-A2 isoform X1 [Brachionus plicatilis]|uniref:Plexin-A2 isoform X1 n=1 Tax=Brachionus plicatilis TaxID=10195 RepID=A0A3M7RJA3_BRAPC|nr:plexin-A2 isoform X1 [Brachionus plicatilis]
MSAETSSIQDIIDLKTRINKLTINPSSQKIDLYIASTNHLYKITDTNGDRNSLKVDIDLTTGPKAQKQQCAYITEYSSSITTQCIKYICDDDSHPISKKKKYQNLIDNQNRLLLIDHKNQHLVECGTVDYGGCRLRQLNTLEIIGCNYSAPVIPFNSAAGVVISSSMSSSTHRIDDSSLYLMVSNEYDPVERVARSDFPIFSTRYLATTHTSTHSESSRPVVQSRQPLFQSKYPIESMNYDESIFDADFHMKIVYSFKHNGFIYFLFTITNKILSESCNRIDADKLPNKKIPKIVTRMLRICDSKMFKNYQPDSLNSLSSILSSSATLTETTIDCDDHGSKFHLLQSARFHELTNKTVDNSMLFLTFNNSNESRICQIKIKQIDEHYEKMLKNCLKGDNTYAELVSPYSNKNTWKTPCRCSVINEFPYQTSREYNPSLFCQNDFFNYMNSRKTLSTQSIRLDADMEPVTAIASLNTDHTDRIILIVSTVDAKIGMLVHSLEKNTASIYEQINLLKSAHFYHRPTLSKSAVFEINLDLVSVDSGDVSKRLLYATYDKYLFKIDLQNCQQYQNCDTCRSVNPFCGWCVYTQKCTLKKSCQIETNSYWIQKSSEHSQRCPSVDSVSPGSFFSPVIDHSRTDEYKFLLNYELKNDVEYVCSLLGERALATLGSDPNELKCNLSDVKKKLGLDYVKSKFVNLSVEIRTDKALLAKSNLIAFNCSYFADCSQCLDKKLSGGCSWCAKNAKCVFSNQARSACPNEVNIYRLLNDNPLPSDICTTFSTQGQLKSKIEIPYSADSNLNDYNKFYINNPYPEYQTSFKCLFTKDKHFTNSKQFKFSSTNLKWTSSDSQLKKSFFNCHYSPNKDQNIINSNLPMQTIYVSIWWSSAPNRLNNSSDLLSNWHQVKFYKNSSQPSQNWDFIAISVVNCEIKASSCGKCMDKQLVDIGCGWCKSLSKCTMESDCDKTGVNKNWLNTTNSEDYCQNPKIFHMSPSCGPKIGAGTIIRISGENLAHDSSEISVKMKPIQTAYSSQNEDLECQTLPDLYQPASQVVCKTTSLYTSSSEYSMYVMTNIKSQNNKHSSFNKSDQFIFNYVMPHIESIEPSRGIKSGGTLLKIKGKNLKCGSTIGIKFLAFGKNCTIVNNYSDNETSDLDIVYCRTPFFDHTDASVTTSQIEFKMDDFSQVLDSSKFTFEYVDDPNVVAIEPEQTILSGGLTMKIKGRGFDSVQTVSLVLSTVPILNSGHKYDDGEQKMLSIFKSSCLILNSTMIECAIPELKDDRLLGPNQNPVDYSFYIQFNELASKFSNQNRQQIKVYPNPVLDNEQIFSDKSQIILIKGENLLRGVQEVDYQVVIGLNNECNITSVTMNIIACILPDLDASDKNVNSENEFFFIRKKRSFFADPRSKVKSYEVKVKIGKNFAKPIGLIKYEVNSNSRFDLIGMRYIIFSACLISMLLFLTMIAFFVILKRKQSKQIRQLKRMQTEFENLEMRVARECKEAFTELQMDIGELANTLNQTGAPFHDFQTYCMKIFFPNTSETDKYYMTTMIDLRLNAAYKENVRNGVSIFSQLIMNKNFLLTFIHTLEADSHNFLLQDRINLASYLSICLQDRLDYFTDILFTLVAELIQKVIESKNNPKILFRRNESIAEKMLTNWFAFLLYDFIKECTGTPLYILFLSLKQQIYKGPVDAITFEARYSLSEDKLIRQSIDYDTITIRVQLQDFDDAMHEISVKVLSCDTITQVKEKILDSFFKGYPFSKRPNVDDLDLIYIPSEWNKSGRLILFDEDKTCKMDNDDYKKLNTLAHYKVSNGALLVLVYRQTYQLLQSPSNDCNSYTLLDTVRNAENMTLLSKSSKSSSSPPTYSKLASNEYSAFSAMHGSTTGLTETLFNPANSTRMNQNHQLIIRNTLNHNVDKKNKKYHLIKYNGLISTTTPNIKDDKKQEIAAKLVSEVYLTRLLATKGGMQSYVDDFFETVFSTAHGSNVLPRAIKYFYDFLDEQASLHGITDPDVVYTWKSNSLPLRFWVNIIKNPDFVFDIHKSNIVDASLSVIASTFMDSCSLSRLDLNKESPSGKLLFYKEVHKYRKWVESYYTEIRQMPKISESEMNELLAEESKKHSASFNKNNSLYKLYNDYVKKNRAKLEISLKESQDTQNVSLNQHLNYRLQQVIYLMDAIEV